MIKTYNKKNIIGALVIAMIFIATSFFVSSLNLVNASPHGHGHNHPGAGHGHNHANSHTKCDHSPGGCNSGGGGGGGGGGGAANNDADDLKKMSVTQIDVLKPKPPGVRQYDPNEKIDLSVNFTWYYCTNYATSMIGRITSPVPAGTSHSGWTSNYRTGNTYPAEGGRNWRYRPGNYQQSFRAPSAPGIYKIKYSVGIDSKGLGNKTEQGTVYFEVRDTSLPDIPPLDDEIIVPPEDDCPNGYIQKIDELGYPYCIPGDKEDEEVELDHFGLSCKASATSIDPGGSVDFKAKIDRGSKANFTWYNGSIIDNDILREDSNVEAGDSRELTRVFDDKGYYVTTVRAYRDTEQGVLEQFCRMPVIVGDVDDSLIDPTAGPPSLDFVLENTITNDICRSTWTSENVSGCRLYQAEDIEDTIPTNGSRDLTPGTYNIRCVAIRDGSEIISQTRVCSGLGDIQEQ